MKTLPVIMFLVLLGVAQADAQQISISGGNPVLRLTSAGIAGGIIDVANSTTVLEYKRVTKKTKITVQASCPNQKFDLSVEAVSAAYGSSSGVVDLKNGMAAANFIVNISQTDKSSSYRTAKLFYKASSSFTQGNSTELGNDTFTITYTQTAQ